jgi:hypothetical protein
MGNVMPPRHEFVRPLRTNHSHLPSHRLWTLGRRRIEDSQHAELETYEAVPKTEAILVDIRPEAFDPGHFSRALIVEGNVLRVAMRW